MCYDLCQIQSFGSILKCRQRTVEQLESNISQEWDNIHPKLQTLVSSQLFRNWGWICQLKCPVNRDILKFESY